MSTIHRKDLAANDFMLLAKLSWLFCRFKPESDDHLYVGTFYSLGTIRMNIPLWYLAGDGWRLAKFKQIEQEAIGIETACFRRICCYLRCREAKMIDTLYRFSMLGVFNAPLSFEKRQFRMPFSGHIKGLEHLYEPDAGCGFIIERRRLEGKFRSSGLSDLQP